MTTSATIIADSISPTGQRLTTLQICAHRFVLAEFNTHRVFSRNFRSSRAVPAAKLIQEVRDNPGMPVYWGKNQNGMQAREALDEAAINKAKEYWHRAAFEAAKCAELLADTGLHKQIANRVLEPFLYVHGVVTSTEWENFFGLRLHEDAQPEMRALAEAMHHAMANSTPDLLQPGQWHLPYMPRGASGEDAIKQSVARCARVSYKPFDADRPSNLDEDLALYEKLVGSHPMHASPAEHQATPDDQRYNVLTDSQWWLHRQEHGNFTGWRQHRKMLPGEAVAPMPKGF